MRHLGREALPQLLLLSPGTPRVTFKSYSTQGMGGAGKLQETGHAALTECRLSHTLTDRRGSSLV